MRFLIDMNLSPQGCPRLRDTGYEATHWSEVGPGDAPDGVLMAWAERNGATVLTHDLDFGAMLAHTGDAGPSVVQIREQDVDPERVGEAVLAAIAQCRELLQGGALVTVDLRRAKARVLPIRRDRSP